MPQHDIALESPWRRIKLVPPSAIDDEAVAACRTHPVTRRFLRFLPTHMTADEVKVRRESRAEDSRILDFYIHHLQEDGTGRFAGLTGHFNLDTANESCEAGIILAPELHGKNLATEVFYVLLEYIFEAQKLHRVTFETGSDNIAMRSWLEGVAGIRLEAERKECWKQLDGTFADVKGYAILDSEWRDTVKSRLARRLNGI
ncbi:hypothetical protein M413DRAFT_28715 [Hebeloma cylindrosporum]|uniref:N-acetyltransferase domain-containing protein n=1 Tax=Hebeloma cylindrosporum TaxID=76867 RepID=A0A0C2YGI8_HEBCY|nr:hypothetical protein M413DRAFT_28715 [Hebeloma cylindrosporum h7]